MPYAFCFKINKVKIHRVITIGTTKIDTRKMTVVYYK